MLTLFLDRDGVLNTRLPDEYVRHIGQLQLEPNVPKALAMLREYFGRMVVVTNQAGVGRGLMTAADLDAIHAALQAEIRAAGGHIDWFYACTHAKDIGCDCRKPATGMAYEALRDFPDIDFAQSWMVGDSVSDIQFGQALGMRTVLIEGKVEDAAAIAKLILPPDYRFPTLYDFAVFTKANQNVLG
jgi:D-glycero-D-manno-heptose 1,7-bisphosphate phosphatase